MRAKQGEIPMNERAMAEGRGARHVRTSLRRVPPRVDNRGTPALHRSLQGGGREERPVEPRTPKLLDQVRGVMRTRH